MARLTKEEHESYMRNIMDRFDNPDDGAEMIEALRADFDESMQAIDGVPAEQYNELQSNYIALREKYIERFFGGNEDLLEAKEGQKEDIENDKKELTYEALFENAESYTGKDE